MTATKKTRVSAGKRFEKDFIKSMPPEATVFRLNDAGGWSNATNTRFTVKNICDYIIYRNPYLGLLELKSHTGKHLPLSCISPTQIDGLSKNMGKAGIFPGIVVNFRDVNKTYFVHISQVLDIINAGKIKSISLMFCEENAIYIRQERKRVNYSYFLDCFFESLKLKFSGD